MTSTIDLYNSAVENSSAVANLLRIDEQELTSWNLLEALERSRSATAALQELVNRAKGQHPNES